MSEGLGAVETVVVVIADDAEAAGAAEVADVDTVVAETDWEVGVGDHIVEDSGARSEILDHSLLLHYGILAGTGRRLAFQLILGSGRLVKGHSGLKRLHCLRFSLS